MPACSIRTSPRLCRYQLFAVPVGYHEPRVSAPCAGRLAPVALTIVTLARGRPLLAMPLASVFFRWCSSPAETEDRTPGNRSLVEPQMVRTERDLRAGSNLDAPHRSGPQDGPTRRCLFQYGLRHERPCHWAAAPRSSRRLPALLKLVPSSPTACKEAVTVAAKMMVKYRTCFS